jgi:isopenicillin N synthase-like dioxygenase
MDVKVCSYESQDFEKDFIDSVINTGFAVITDHGISEDLIRETQSEWRQFFLSGSEIKNVFVNEEDGNMGYKGMGSEKAVGAKVADLKEFFHWKPGSKIPFNVSGLTQALFGELSYVGDDLLRIIDELDGTNYSEACWDSDNTLLRTLYYPSLDFKKVNGAVRAAAHEDINFITLLVAASAPGLQVFEANKNKWHDVPHEDNSIVVNIGDMLQLASKGKYISTTHRVVNPERSSQDRI